MARTSRLALARFGRDPTFYYDYDPDLLLSSEAAALLGVPHKRFLRYIQRGWSAPHCVLEGGCIRLYHRRAVLALKERLRASRVSRPTSAACATASPADAKV